MAAKRIVITDTAPTIWRALAMDKRLAQNGIFYQSGMNLARDEKGNPGRMYFAGVGLAWIITTVVRRG